MSAPCCGGASTLIAAPAGSASINSTSGNAPRTGNQPRVRRLLTRAVFVGGRSCVRGVADLQVPEQVGTRGDCLRDVAHRTTGAEQVQRVDQHDRVRGTGLGDDAERLVEGPGLAEHHELQRAGQLIPRRHFAQAAERVDRECVPLVLDRGEHVGGAQVRGDREQRLDAVQVEIGTQADHLGVPDPHTGVRDGLLGGGDQRRIAEDVVAAAVRRLLQPRQHGVEAGVRCHPDQIGRGEVNQAQLGQAHGT